MAKLMRKIIAISLSLLMVFAIAANMTSAWESNNYESVMREESVLTETAVESLSIVEELAIDGQRLLLEDSINFAMELMAETHVSVTGGSTKQQVLGNTSRTYQAFKRNSRGAAFS